MYVVGERHGGRSWRKDDGKWESGILRRIMTLAITALASRCKMDNRRRERGVLHENSRDMDDDEQVNGPIKTGGRYVEIR